MGKQFARIEPEHVAFIEHRLAVDAEEKWSRTIDCDGGRAIQAAGLGFEVDAKAAELLAAFGQSAARGQHEQRDREKAIEHAKMTPHIRSQANASRNQSKETMGKQYNKVEKRQRRKAYNKRKKVASKTKKKSAKS